MDGKRLVKGFLLVFVVASLGVLLFRERDRRPEAGYATAGSSGASPAVAVPDGAFRPGESPGQGTRVVAYYFHGKFRCASCLRIESLSGKAIREGFPEELRSGRLAFRDVNVEEPGNRRFIDEYRLVSQSLVIVEFRDGRRVRWKTLEKVWTLLGKEKEFFRYVRDSVASYLGGE
jgi:hypothetical protein